MRRSAVDGTRNDLISVVSNRRFKEDKARAEVRLFAQRTGEAFQFLRVFQNSDRERFGLGRLNLPCRLAIGAVEYVERSRSTLLCRPAEERLGIWKPRKDFSDLIAQFVRIGLWRERIKLRKYLALHTAHVAAQCCIHQRRYFERSLFHQKPCAALPF